MNLLPGDRAIMQKRGGLAARLIGWWTNSPWSHVEPIIGADGCSVDATWPRLIESNVHKYLTDEYAMIILRPIGWTEAQRNSFAKAARGAISMKYDILSYLGFPLNVPVQDKRKLHCAELCLMADHAAGEFLGHDGAFVTPQTYWDFYIAGAFEVVH